MSSRVQARFPRQQQQLQQEKVSNNGLWTNWNGKKSISERKTTPGKIQITKTKDPNRVLKT